MFEIYLYRAFKHILIIYMSGGAAVYLRPTPGLMEQTKQLLYSNDQ